MNIHRLSSCAILMLLIAIGCANDEAFERVDALRCDPAWPVIRATAETEIARRKGNTQWSSAAHYTPKQRTNGVWVVVASGAYPDNTLGDHVDLLIRDDGEIVSYAPRRSRPPK
jgi:hypothetical protein